MDPNETLKVIRESIRIANIKDLPPSMRYTIMQDAISDFEALDQWLSKGGFLPDDWDTRCFCQNREQ